MALIEAAEREKAREQKDGEPKERKEKRDGSTEKRTEGGRGGRGRGRDSELVQLPW